MAKDENKVRQEAKERRDASLERKLDRAREFDSRVVTARDFDTNTFINLLSQTDRALSTGKSQIGVYIEPEDIMKNLAQLRNAMLIVEDVTIELCNKTGVKYFSPKALKAYREKIANEAVKK